MNELFSCKIILPACLLLLRNYSCPICSAPIRSPVFFFYEKFPKFHSVSLLQELMELLEEQGDLHDLGGVVDGHSGRGVAIEGAVVGVDLVTAGGPIGPDGVCKDRVRGLEVVGDG